MGLKSHAFNPAHNGSYRWVPAGRQVTGRPTPTGRVTSPSSSPAARSPPPIHPCFYAWQLAPKPYLCAKCSVRAHTHGQRDPPVDSHKAWTVWCISQTPIVRFGCVFVLAFSFLQPSSCSELRAYSSEQLGIVALLAPMYQCLGPVHWKGCGS